MIKEITIEHEGIKLGGHICAVPHARSWVIFAHGSGSSRKSSRNNWVASELNRRGHATLLFDLLTPKEDLNYDNRFNLPLLAQRLALATGWLLRSPNYQGQPLAYFGASTGAGAALVAASKMTPNTPLFTVISRGGRPDLAGKSTLQEVSVPVLLIVGSLDREVITLNEMARTYLRNSELQLVNGATHLFEEAGKLNDVVERTAFWLDERLKSLDTHLRPGNISEGGDYVVP
jgi:putative phosphoribosyl transferase